MCASSTRPTRRFVEPDSVHADMVLPFDARAARKSSLPVQSRRRIALFRLTTRSSHRVMPQVYILRSASVAGGQDPRLFGGEGAVLMAR
jgi:hypothetical protein